MDYKTNVSEGSMGSSDKIDRGLLGVPDNMTVGTAIDLLLVEIARLHDEVNRLVSEQDKISRSGNQTIPETVITEVPLSKLNRLKAIRNDYRNGSASAVASARRAAWAILKAPKTAEVAQVVKPSVVQSRTAVRSDFAGDTPIRTALQRGDLDIAYLWIRALFPKHGKNKNFVHLAEKVAAARGNLSQSVALANHKLQNKWVSPEAVRVAEGRLIELETIPGLVSNPIEVRDRTPKLVLHLVKESVPYRSNGFCSRSFENLRAETMSGYKPLVITEPGFPAKAEWNGSQSDEIEGIQHLRLLPGAEAVTKRLPADEFNQLFAELGMAIAQKYRPSVIHASSGRRGFETAKSALAISRATGIPLVYEIRSFFEGTWTSNIEIESKSEIFEKRLVAEKECAEHADKVITISKTMRDELISWGVDPGKISIAPNGVDVSRFTPGDKNPALQKKLGLEGKITIGYVSNFDHARESQETLVRATKRLLDEGFSVNCLLVGGGARQEPLKKLSEELGIADNVVFTGLVKHEDIVDYYRLIDVFVVPRRAERAANLVTPLKPFEAMACGIPVIVSDLPALREIVESPSRGQYFKERDDRDLALVLKQLISDPEERARLARAGREWVVENRQWSRNGEVYAAVYEALEGKKHAE
ncbi:glycosyltransferase family 4 protein [uncultured Corynebacterium sp.]|uniref:glycosyltransferase family 4 protein n=1 Tax=uncultured Corynebacterium sp. TaxID=159447 RepID=UPI00259530A9|nr:glycosyltransferase family 4 protein [uncultured Corynebacterium sp.]